MKTKLAAAALFSLTAAAVVFVPQFRTSGAVTRIDPPVVAPRHLDSPQIDVVFVLDTTGSMAGLINAAKEKIWSIASTMASAQHAPHIRMGLVAYRDRGDAYVTRRVELSDDLDSVYAALMDFTAKGGGDTPEAVNEALHEAVNKMAWRAGNNTYKAVFLVGDAPPHMDYRDDVPYGQTLNVAANKGIVVNTIQSGAMPSTVKPWREIASLGSGEYFNVETDGNAIAIDTPFDRQLAALSAELDRTRLSYGSAEDKRKSEAKRKATDKLHAEASQASRARRATFNVSKSGEANAHGEGDLLADIAKGRVKLEELEREVLPSALQAMEPSAQAAFVEQTAERRKALRKSMKELAEKRSSYLEKKVASSDSRDDSLDEKLYGAIRAQAAKSGIKYDKDSASY